MAALGGERLQAGQDREVALVQHPLVHRRLGEARPLRRALARTVFSGQEARLQREVGDDADVVGLARRHQLPLDAALEQVVVGLHRHERVEVQRPRRLQRLDEVPAVEVRAADVAHLPRPHQVVEGPQGLLDGRRAVHRVHLVEVEIVGLKAAQAAFELAEDVPPRAALHVGPRSHREAELGGKDHLVPPPLERLPDDRLRVGAGVDVGGVEEVGADVDRRVDHPPRRRLVGTSAEVVRAEPQERHGEPARP